MNRGDSAAAWEAFSTQLAAILQDADPIVLIASGAPPDEYSPEVGTILPRLREARSANDVQRIAHEEFVRWYGAETARGRNAYEGLGVRTWQAMGDAGLRT